MQINFLLINPFSEKKKKKKYKKIKMPEVENFTQHVKR